MKKYVKKVNSAIKLYLRSVKEKEKEEAKKEEEKQIRINKEKKRKLRKSKARENRVNEIAEAITKANSFEYKLKSK